MRTEDNLSRAALDRPQRSGIEDESSCGGVGADTQRATTFPIHPGTRLPTTGEAIIPDAIWISTDLS